MARGLLIVIAGKSSQPFVSSLCTFFCFPKKPDDCPGKSPQNPLARLEPESYIAASRDHGFASKRFSAVNRKRESVNRAPFRVGTEVAKRGRL
jgi:hypothetical protein